MPEPRYDVSLLINGEDCPASSGAVGWRHDPVTQQATTRFAAATVKDARLAATAAAQAFPGWSSTPPSERRRFLLKTAECMRRRAPELEQRMQAEIGATRSWINENIELALEILIEAASLTTQIRGQVLPSKQPQRQMLALRQPVGAVLGIAPWNAPLILGVRAVATPLACGNTVVFKLSELAPATQRWIADCFQEAGLPPGVLNVISHAPDDAPAVVEALIAHPSIRRINFTGSTRVGRHIANTAARHLKPALLELGGKAPLLVLKDADLNAAVEAAIHGAFTNQGQICMATDRVIVDASIADQFCTHLAARASALVVGDPRNPAVDLGALATPEAGQRLMQLVEDAMRKGAQLCCGGHLLAPCLMQATVLDKVRASMSLYHEEAFGPIISVIRVSSPEEALGVANDCEYGLSASIFSRDFNQAMKLAEKLESGICHINGSTVHDEAHVPFGGVKQSGYGRFGGMAGIDAFTEQRWISFQA